MVVGCSSVAAATAQPVALATPEIPTPSPTPKFSGYPTPIATSVSVGPNGVIPAQFGRRISLEGFAFVSRQADCARARIFLEVVNPTPEGAIATVSTLAALLEEAIGHVNGTRISGAELALESKDGGRGSHLVTAFDYVDLSIDEISELPAIRAAVARVPRATIGVEYDIRDTEGAGKEALVAALAAERSQAQLFVARTGRKLEREHLIEASSNRYEAISHRSRPLPETTVVKYIGRAIVVYDVIQP